MINAPSLTVTNFIAIVPKPIQANTFVNDAKASCGMVARGTRIRVPVGVLADPGDVEGARPRLPGVRDDGSVDDDVGGTAGVGMERTAGEHGDIPQGDRDHSIASGR